MTNVAASIALDITVFLIFIVITSVHFPERMGASMWDGRVWHLLRTV
jgi:hypothetical protein